MEKLGQLRAEADRTGIWDLIVVDTPPSRSALDFLDAPKRLGSFLDGRFIRLPYAVPYIFSALKVAITLSVIGAVVAEFVAAERGLGYLILFTTSTFKVPMAFAALTLLVASSLLLYGLIVWLHRRCFPWSL